MHETFQNLKKIKLHSLIIEIKKIHLILVIKNPITHHIHQHPSTINTTTTSLLI